MYWEGGDWGMVGTRDEALGLTAGTGNRERKHPRHAALCERGIPGCSLVPSP